MIGFLGAATCSGAQASVKKTGIGDEAFQYDNAGRLIRHTQWGNQHFYFSYDSAGNRTVMINPDAQQTYYGYDARNTLSALTDPWGHTSYHQRDPIGREIAKLLPKTPCHGDGEPIGSQRMCAEPHRTHRSSAGSE